VIAAVDRFVVGVATFALCACGERIPEPPPRPLPPPLPPLTLTAREAALRSAADAASPTVDPTRLRQLCDLVEASFAEAGADARTAARALQSLSDEPEADQVAAFEASLEHADVGVRLQCAYRIGLSGRRSALPLLAKRLKYETDRRVWSWLVAATMRLRNDAFCAGLAALMNDATTADEAGRATLDALNARGVATSAEPTFVELQQKLHELHAHWHAHGIAFGTDAADRDADDERRLQGRIAKMLLDLMQFQLRPVDEARFVVARLGVDALPLLSDTAWATETELRVQTLEIVLALGPVAAPLTPRLLALLGDPRAVGDALVTLGNVGATEAVPHLAFHLNGDDPELAMRAALGFGALGDKAALPALRARFDDPKATLDVRVACAYALGMCGDDGTGRSFLQERLDRGEYHEPRLRLYLDRIDAKSR
jgi:HEAT repeat protein